MSRTAQYILDQIQEAKAKNLKQLLLLTRFNEPKLTEIPEEIFELEQLEELVLYDHAITSVPDKINKLQKLKILDLRGNPLKQITDINGLILDFEIYQALKTQLVPQQISGLRVKLDGDDLPPELFELSNLSTLYLSDNQLRSVPESITRHNKLISLDLSYNNLRSLPESITRLRQLTTLDLGSNKLRSLPESITGLQQLTVLDLSGNNLRSLPESITRLQQLTTLDLSRNNLRSLPESITRLPHLKTVSLAGNPLESPPLEVAVQGIEKIRDYFRQLEEEGVDHLYEAKLLIVGEGGAGKTTLAKKIEDPNYVLQRDEASTQGIDVITWHFPLKDVENGRSFRVNIWDFGGQEIYHATHQFFLTKRSLYALVVDTRKENADFYYWLNVVELFADNSPLLIIKNEKQDRRREINERQLRGEFHNLMETLATNLETKRGLPAVLDAVQYHIRNLPHVGSPLPKTWVKVREALERDPRYYITFTEYLAICETHGFRRDNDKLQLSGYLHDLGVCLHFQDDPVLKNSVIIKPDWATDAVYRVLDNPTVIDNQGEFSKDDLAKIWHEPKYATMHDELLQLMLKFNLCYRIEHSDSYMAPQLLSLNQPDYAWDERDNLLLRYEYTFMPKGIMTRFIVAMHDLIWKQDYVWRSGVILQDKQSKAEVIEHYGKRELNVRVVGQQKKELISIIRHELEQIHRSFKHLKYQQLVPCNCESCFRKQNPHFYNFDMLLKFRAHGQYQIQCHNSYRMVDVRLLIDDTESTMPPSRRREGDIDRDRPSLSLQMPPDESPPKNWFEVVQQYAEKLFVFFFALSFLTVLSTIFTVFDLSQFQKFLFWLLLTILLTLYGLFVLVWNRAQRTRSARGIDFLLVVLITVAFGWQTYQPNVDNSCPNVTLTVSPTQIESGQSAKLTVVADDPEGDLLNYTWQATIPGLLRESGPYANPENEYTASAEAAGEKVTITVHVNDNVCGQPVSQEVTIPILLPDN